MEEKKTINSKWLNGTNTVHVDAHDTEKVRLLDVEGAICRVKAI